MPLNKADITAEAIAAFEDALLWHAVQGGPFQCRWVPVTFSAQGLQMMVSCLSLESVPG